MGTVMKSPGNHRLALCVGLLLLGCVAMAPGGAGGATAAGAPACHVGAYRLQDGEIIDVGATSTRGTLRWHRVDGTTGTLARRSDGSWRGHAGWTQRDDPVVVGFGTCAGGRINFGGRLGQRLPLEVIETRFRGRDVTLRGRLVMPEGEAAVPVVVLVHGSEAYSGVDYYHVQHLFPAHGIGVFVYDKRGTGQSSGSYTQDFDVLADDAVAALAEARRLGGRRIARIGFRGSSQGGWVAPLAATRSDVDYLQVAYGLAESPAAEDREQVMQELVAAGYGPEVLAMAREVTDATGAMMGNPSRDTAAQVAAVRRKYRDAAWWPVMQGEFTGSLLRYPAWLSLVALPWFDKGTPWTHDPMPVLRQVSVPQQWMIAADDREAPPAETLRRLALLQAEGHRIETVVFPGTDHGIVAFEVGAEGVRERTRYAAGYHRQAMDFILGRGDMSPVDADNLPP